jgi:hypothetical protein
MKKVERSQHGGYGTPEYSVWSAMRARCLNPAHSNYRHYGGRGIQVCERWESFANFLADMGPRPSLRHSIERTDSNGNYEPGNCRWATPAEQARNKSTNRFFTLNGETMCLTDWAKRLGVSPDCLAARLRRGTPPELALTEAPHKGKSSGKRRASRLSYTPRP